MPTLLNPNSSNAPNRDGMDIDTIMERFGFYLVSKNCRVVCLKNAPKTVKELETANNLKAALPEWVQEKVIPALNSDAETPPHLLVTLTDIVKNKKVLRKAEKLKRENTPIETVTNIEHTSSDDEDQTEHKEKVLKNHRNSMVLNPLAMQKKSENLDMINKNAPSTSQCYQKSRGAPYLCEEEIAIVRYILDNNYELAVGGNNLWMAMEENKVCDRTWQSMKNRFRKSVLTNLRRPELHLTEQEIKRLRNPNYDYAKQKIDGLRKKSSLRKTNVSKKKDSDGFYSMDLNWSDSE